MDIHMGNVKAQANRDSGILKPRPCSITGSSTSLLVEYPVPVYWEDTTEKDLRQLLVEAQQEADETDLAKLRENMTLLHTEKPEPPTVEVKTEPLTPEDKN